jgi:hypothetical protein
MWTAGPGRGPVRAGGATLAGSAEREGVVANVVFATAIDLRGDGVADIYYGMAASGSAPSASRCPWLLPE